MELSADSSSLPMTSIVDLDGLSAAASSATPSIFSIDFLSGIENKTQAEIEKLFEDFVFPVDQPSVSYRMVVALAYGSLAVCGLLANMLFCVVVLRCRKLHTVTHILMSNLAASNVLFLLFHPAYFINTFILEESWRFGTFLCKMSFSISYLTATGSFYLMCLVAVDRWLAIFSRKRRLDQKKCLILIVIAWFISFLVALPYMYLSTLVPLGANVSIELSNHTHWTTNGLPADDHRMRCGCETPHWLKQLLFSTIFVQYVMPLLVMVPAYAHLAVFLWRRPTIGVQSREKMKKQMRRRRRLLATLLAIVGFLIACWLPLFAVNILISLHLVAYQTSLALYIYTSMVTILGVLATPICYLMNDVFRQQTLSLLSRLVPGWNYGSAGAGTGNAKARSESTNANGQRLLTDAPPSRIACGTEEDSRCSPSLRSSRRGTPVDLLLLAPPTGRSASKRSSSSDAIQSSCGTPC